MKKFLTLILFFTFGSSRAQWIWDFGGTLGASNYLGDIGGRAKDRRNFVADLKIAKTRWNLGAFARHRFAPGLSGKFAVDYIRLEGNDKLSSNPGRQYRNFNFRNDIVDVNYTVEVFLFSNNDLGKTYLFRNNLRIYAFTGVGVFTNNPKTFYRGQWVALRPYATEGYAYKRFVLNIPMGIGAYITLNKRNRFGIEIDYRKTFTDYIDDISGNYPSEPPADEYLRGLVLRTTELDRDANPGAYESHTWGAKRGDSQHKDSYATLNLTYSRVIRGNPRFQKGKLFRKKKRSRIIHTRF